MKLIIELPVDRYEAVVSGAESILDARLEAIEVRQDGGLLSTEMRVAGVALIGGNVVLPGLDEGSGPRVRVFIAEKEVST